MAKCSLTESELIRALQGKLEATPGVGVVGHPQEAGVVVIITDGQWVVQMKNDPPAAGWRVRSAANRHGNSGAESAAIRKALEELNIGAADMVRDPTSPRAHGQPVGHARSRDRQERRDATIRKPPDIL